MEAQVVRVAHHCALLEEPSPFGTITAASYGQIALSTPCGDSTHTIQWDGTAWAQQAPCDREPCRDVRKALRNLGRGNSSERAARWVAAGVFTAPQTHEWKAFSAESAGLWIAEGLEPAAAKQWRAWTTPAGRRPWAQSGIMNGHHAEGWKNAGVAPGEAALWHAAGISPTDFTSWSQFSRSLTDVIAWAHDCGTSPRLAAHWFRINVETSTAREWVSEGFDAAQYLEWNSKAGLNDPSEAAVWRATYLPPEYVPRLQQAGLTPTAAVDLIDALPESRSWVASIQDALRWADVESKPDEVRAWTALGISPDTAGLWRDAGFKTAADVCATLTEGRHRVDVECGGDLHHVDVRWDACRASWAAPDHNRRLEATASAFGGNPPRCVQVVDLCRRARSVSDLASPGAILDWATSADPNCDVFIDRATFRKAPTSAWRTS